MFARRVHADQSGYEVWTGSAEHCKGGQNWPATVMTQLMEAGPEGGGRVLTVLTRADHRPRPAAGQGKSGPGNDRGARFGNRWWGAAGCGCGAWCGQGWVKMGVRLHSDRRRRLWRRGGVTNRIASAGKRGCCDLVNK